MAALGPVPSIIQRPVVDAALTAFSLHGPPPPRTSETNPNTGSTRPAWILAGGNIRTCPPGEGRTRNIGIGQSWEASLIHIPRRYRNPHFRIEVECVAVLVYVVNLQVLHHIRHVIT